MNGLISTSQNLAELIAGNNGFYRDLFNEMNEGILMVDLKESICYANDRFCQMLGYEKDHLLSLKTTDFLSEELSEEWLAQKTADRMAGLSDRFQIALRAKNGSKIWAQVSVSPIKNEQGTVIGTLGIHTNITANKLQEDYLEKISKEKDILLKETHHRVKNNLQIISSLLSLQSNAIDDRENVKDILQTSQNRVKAMALLHEVIYKSDNLANIQFTEYIKLLVSQLSSVLSFAEKGIKVVTHTKVDALDLDSAVLCGMIVNELVSNALEHAFNQPVDEPLISVKSVKLEDTIVLSVKDNGCGLPSDFDFRDSKRLGLQLVNALTDQLDGTIELDSSLGTEFRIEFPVRLH